MYIVEGLKLNKFRSVNIPSGKELFKRFGVSLGISFSGDSVCPPPTSKIDTISQAARMNETELLREARDAESASRAAAAAQAASAAQETPAAPASPGANV